MKVEILKDSTCWSGSRMTTFVVEYPRLIHSELLTHRLLSRNSSSSRAIPFNKMVEQLDGIPVRFGGNQSGMQDSGEHNQPIEVNCHVFGNSSYTPEEFWNKAKTDMVNAARFFHVAGYHKQIFNRLTEPFQMMRTIISGTEWNNFFWLRDHEAADPTLHALAREMKRVYDESVPEYLHPGEWHLPYINITRIDDYPLYQDTAEGTNRNYNLEDAKKISTARCAAVSFRNTDYDLEKSVEVYDRLVGDERKHASAFEHQATPIETSQPYTNNKGAPITWEPGISHMDKDSNLWSGNLKGWIQHRKLISGECL